MSVLTRLFVLSPGLLLGASVTFNRAAIAREITEDMPTAAEIEATALDAAADTGALPTAADLDTYQLPAAELLDPDPMAQVTSVTDLSDVAPTDWAYTALQTLVENYGCIAGYPDGTFRGDRPLTRYEFAAGLNACLESLAFGDLSVEDLERIRALTAEFQTELTSLGAQVDNLEGRVTFLEENQFSTTTKLTGNVFMNFTAAGAGGDIQAETNDPDVRPLTIRRAARDAGGDPIVSTIADDPDPTFSYYTWLNFNTSFTGRDLLVTQLTVGNGTSPANTYISAGLFNTFGIPFTDQTGSPNANQVGIRELFYAFPATEDLTVVAGPRINWYRYFDQSQYTFFLTGASSFNSIGSTLSNPIDRGSGIAFLWDLGEKFDINAAYLGENTEFLTSAFFNTASDPTEGLFGGTWTATVQLHYAPSPDANIRLYYTRARLDNNVPVLDENGNITGFGVGGATGEPIYGVADDGFGGSIEAYANTVGLTADWRVTDWLGLFGRYTFGNVEIDPKNDARDDGDVNTQAFQFGLAFPDLGKEGALGTFSFVVPFDVIGGEEFLASGAGDGGTQYDLELTYFYPVNANIAIVPAFYVILNPNNFSDNSAIYVGNLRTQFSF